MFKYTLIAQAIRLSMHSMRTGFDQRAYYTKIEAIQKAVKREEK